MGRRLPVVVDSMGDGVGFDGVHQKALIGISLCFESFILRRRAFSSLLCKTRH
jgi:hypothetical protein